MPLFLDILHSFSVQETVINNVNLSLDSVSFFGLALQCV
jgi:hypothetical protein